MNIKFKSFFVPPGMLVRIKRSGGKKNVNGIRGVGVWSHRTRFDSAVEINAFTKGQFKQMNGDGDDKIHFGDDSIHIEVGKSVHLSVYFSTIFLLYFFYQKMSTIIM